MLTETPTLGEKFPQLYADALVSEIASVIPELRATGGILEPNVPLTADDPNIEFWHHDHVICGLGADEDAAGHPIFTVWGSDYFKHNECIRTVIEIEMSNPAALDIIIGVLRDSLASYLKHQT